MKIIVTSAIIGVDASGTADETYDVAPEIAEAFAQTMALDPDDPLAEEISLSLLATDDELLAFAEELAEAEYAEAEPEEDDIVPLDVWAAAQNWAA